MFTTFAGGWPSLVLWMFHRSWHSSVVLGEACALDVNTFLLGGLCNALVGLSTQESPTVLQCSPVVITQKRVTTTAL